MLALHGWGGRPKTRASLFDFYVSRAVLRDVIKKLEDTGTVAGEPLQEILL